jgi:xanthine dehydrogenase accessory factor
MKCGGQATLSLEYLQGAKNFILFGGGHLGRALAPILDLIGFQVTVCDNREEMRSFIPVDFQKKFMLVDYDDLEGLRTMLEQTQFCFIATHGHGYDYAVLKQALSFSDYDYLGMIGSSSKVRVTLDRLREENITIPDYLFAPVGIKLGGDSAAEIAVAVAAEVIARQHDTPVDHMRIVEKKAQPKAVRTK